MLSPKEKSARCLRWIAAYNLAKGILLLALAIGLLDLLHKDVDTIVGNWIALLGLDLENRHIAALLARLDLVTDKQVGQLSGLTFLFSAVFLAEGGGLFFNQRWAKFLTVIVTASFIPIELYETFHRFGFGKLTLLVLNAAIVALLIGMLRKELREESAQAAAAGTPPALRAVASEDLN